MPSGPGAQSTISLPKFVLVTAQLALLAVALRQFQIESPAFVQLAFLAFAGFVVHAFLPLRFRLPFFLALSLAGIALIFGPFDAAWLVGVGLVLIVICHLPVSYWTRVGLLLLAGSLLAAQRAGWLPAPWSAAVLPILASMFMLRLIVYMYDLRHDSGPVSPARTLSYFFLLPNVCFPLFPVVDYKTFRRTYYDDDAYRIYQTGVSWMARGVVHLILYRFVYYYMTLSPSEVTGPVELGRYIVSNFLLYLRVSGQFHIIVGMLYLFGFRLPETHHLYFLASSFTDFWRRINIYWKDFMLKVVYYPTYFQLKTFGATKALVGATLIVFVATWFLHAYQWFWLRGSFLVEWPDIAFWVILAGLVVINSLWETKYGRARTLKQAAWSPRKAAGRALRTAATFATIVLLWSLWTSESIAAWWALMTTAVDGARTASLSSALPAIALVATLAVLGARGGPVTGPVTGAGALPFSPFQRSVASTILVLGLLAIGGIQSIYSQLGPQAATLVHSLRTGKLNRADATLMERGYYEKLMRVERFNSELWRVYLKKPVALLEVDGTGLDRFTGDFLQKEFTPSSSSLTPYGLIHTNRWGMRDREYDRLPAPGTYRVALLGASSVMGWGVQESETFEALLEARLNQERAGRPYAGYEILNFGVPNYSPLQQLVVLRKALDMAPQAVYYVATGYEASRAARYLTDVVRKQIAIPYPYLRETVAKAGLDAGMDQDAMLRRLRPFQSEILAWTYAAMTQECRERGVIPVLVFLPHVEDGPWRETIPEILATAADAGFTVIDLDGVFRNHDPASVRVAEWDNHPNALGHRLVADRLYDALVALGSRVLPERP